MFNLECVILGLCRMERTCSSKTMDFSMLLQIWASPPTKNNLSFLFRLFDVAGLQLLVVANLMNPKLHYK